MSELVNLIHNIETTRFQTFGVDDPSAMGQPYWGIDMDRATDEALRNIIEDIELLTSNTAMIEPAVKDSFDAFQSKIFDDISRIYNRVLINKLGWVYEDVKDLNNIVLSISRALIDDHSRVPKEIISIH
ncbi:hypothetical protein [Agrobacterium tumefaciens]|uniref:hypothetical protein n=1 Tax=Agrobacterium tumefaciens TaxID=358 RepID=UPI001574407E|nr:hypothetical protein [Agrobacterium tumefaciens]WCJ63819.1 hypothetical protein G6M15_06390 [Agrobacterium tumefaciens]